MYARVPRQQNCQHVTSPKTFCNATLLLNNKETIFQPVLANGEVIFSAVLIPLQSVSKKRDMDWKRPATCN